LGVLPTCFFWANDKTLKSGSDVQRSSVEHLAQPVQLGVTGPPSIADGWQKINPS
jgi:hypothetical protein